MFKIVMIYPELKSLIKKSSQRLTEFTIIRITYGYIKIYLFTSRAL